MHVYGVREFLLSVNNNVHHRARHSHRFLANFQTRIKLLNDKYMSSLQALLVCQYSTKTGISKKQTVQYACFFFLVVFISFTRYKSLQQPNFHLMSNNIQNEGKFAEDKNLPIKIPSSINLIESLFKKLISGKPIH